MEIVIIGDGQVGHMLAKQLSEENYDIVLIDQNVGKIRDDLNELDISCISGNGVDAAIQREANVPNADLVIACTSTDEQNMISCLLARKLGARHTIARVRNPVYYGEIDIFRDDLHLSMAVNPELTAANEIARLLLFPEASKVETFMKGRVEMVEVTVREGNPMIGMALSTIYHHLNVKILVCAAQRGGEIIIPDGDFTLQEKDKLYIAAAHQNLRAFFKLFGPRVMQVKKVIICGCGTMGFYLAAQLLQAGMQVKIIEKNEKRCEELCELLPKATIINGDATDQDILMEEGVDSTDALVAIMDVDEENIILGLFARSLGVNKIIARVDAEARAQMVEDMGIDSTISPKSATADAIMAYVRARNNSLSSENVETLYRLVNGKVEAQEFIIKEGSRFSGVRISSLKVRDNALIACIGRGRQVIIPSGDDHLEVGDSVIVITKDLSIENFSDIIL